MPTPVPALLLALQATLGTGVEATDLAGRALASAPWFEPVRSFQLGDPVDLSIDPARHPKLAGRVVDAYVLEHRSLAEWLGNPKLAGAVRGPVPLAFSQAGVRANTFRIEKGTLSASAGDGIGHGYDVVLDVDRDGFLDDGDVIDGLGATAGFYVVHDLTRPGPHVVTEVLYSGGGFLAQDTYFPSDVGALGALPLVVISHGNGHNYQWYDHLGYHLASYGFVVMSHRNDTGPGIESASQTTLDNVDFLLGHLDTIEGGVLAGHVDRHHMAWFGHSRGGEGIVRAYDRLFLGLVSYPTYDATDVRLLSSIAPTVFLGRGQSNPRGAPFSLWTGGADDDVNGCADCPICQTFRLLERARSTSASISLHGVGHGDFHDGGGSSVASGPCLLGRARTHTIMRGYSLPLLGWFVRGEPAAEDFLWRQWEELRPLGAPRSRCVVVDLMYRPSERDGAYVLDDYQSGRDEGVSSSGGAVVFDVEGLTEATLDDRDAAFTDDAQDPMNGMTQASGEPWRGVVFEWDGTDRHYTLEVPADARDLRRFEFLSLRAAQVTRHPLTNAVRDDLVFSVGLIDGGLRESVLRVDALGGGVEEPYLRTGCGSGKGWANEFETLRFRVTDFASESAIDLSDVVAVELLFGPSRGSAEGRIGLDDLQLEPFDPGRRAP